VINVSNVNFAYDERPILRDLSFNVHQNESAVIMGPSGSGKSTILRLILGLECPSSGEVCVDNQDICRMPEPEKRVLRKQIGMVFQHGALFDSLSVGENVGYYLIEHTKLPWEEIEKRVVEILGFVGLDPADIIDKLPEQLSGGMQRRVAIGRALLSTNPKIMLYDEPTTGLDPQATEKVMLLINKLTVEKKISTIVVTHQIADAITLANRFIVIHGGTVAFDGNLEGLRTCDDPRVVAFLAPFRASFAEVNERRFIA